MQKSNPLRKGLILVIIVLFIGASIVPLTGSKTVEKTSFDPVPDLDCYGALYIVGVEPGETVVGSFTVENIGEPGSELDWEITEYPDWGTWCFDPEYGTDLLAGDTEDIVVEIIVPDPIECELTGEVVIYNSENPDDYCTINVYLRPKSVPVVKNINQNIVNTASSTKSKSIEQSAIPTFDDITIISIQPQFQEVETGETFEVSVWVYPSEPINGIDFQYLYFNATLIHANSVRYDRFFDPYVTWLGWPPFPDIDNVNGEIRNIWEGIIGAGSVTSNGSWVTIEFTAQNTLGVSPLNLDGVQITKEGPIVIPCDINNGNVTIVEEPPEITDVTVLHSIPKDTDPDYGWENFTCTVTDDVAVDTVQLNITYPDSSSHTFAMTKNGDTYYHYTHLVLPGGENIPGYDYHIYATDTSGKESTSPSYLFKLPLNADINEDGRVGFIEIMCVAGQWGDTGPNGWCRTDANNDGIINFLDIMFPCGMWGHEW